MTYSQKNFITYIIIFGIILFLYHFIGYPLLLEYTSLSINVEQGLPYGAIPGDYQTYYLTAIKILNHPLDFYKTIIILGNSNYLAPFIFSLVLRATSSFESLIFYNLMVSLPLSAFIACQLHAVLHRFNIDDAKCFLLNIVVVLSPFFFITFTQISKDLFTHLFYAMSIRTLFLIRDKEFCYLSALSLVLCTLLLVFNRPFQLLISALVWVILAFLFFIKDRKPKDMKGPLWIVLFLVATFLLHSQFVHQAGTGIEFLTDSVTQSIKPTKPTQTIQDESIEETPAGINHGFMRGFFSALNSYRKYYIEANPDSAMVASPGLVFESPIDVIIYLPKALSMVVWEPNPLRLLSSKSGYSHSLLKVLYIPWSFFVLLLSLWALFKITALFTFDNMLLVAYSFGSLLPYPFFIPNYGNIARYSSFLILFLLLVLIFSRLESKKYRP